MTIEIRQFRGLQDNYGFLVRDCASGQVASIDASDADVILGQLDQAGWRLSYVLLRPGLEGRGSVRPASCPKGQLSGARPMTARCRRVRNVAMHRPSAAEAVA